ncbi:MAG: hypothetical protein GX309_04770, partial [Clostridiales bacterium]|nr:hypothetical protein [Clostridiales bacterium]
MSKFKYSDEELQINKALKMNQDTSKTMLNGNNMAGIRKDADSNIGVSLELL